MRLAAAPRPAAHDARRLHARHHARRPAARHCTALQRPIWRSGQDRPERVLAVESKGSRAEPAHPRARRATPGRL